MDYLSFWKFFFWRQTVSSFTLSRVLMGENRHPFFSRSSLFSLICVPPMWQAERRPGARWCHLLISWRPMSRQSGRVTVFVSTYPPIYRHCQQPYQTNRDLQRNEEPERRFDFLRLETERLLGAVNHHARPTFFWCAAQKWYKLHFVSLRDTIKSLAWWRTYSFNKLML